MIAMSNSSQVLIRSLYNRLARVVGLGLAAGTLTGSSGLAQMSSPGFHTAEALSACPEPALSRVFQHRVAEGDTLESIAQQYNLIPDTIRGFNPSLQSGRLAVGQELMIPPFNGIRVTVPQGQTWQDVAQAYNRRADVLFEVNGCVSDVPGEIFVPGVNWFPGVQTVASPVAEPSADNALLSGYPLPNRTDIVVNYGWQPAPAQDRLVFNTGIALAAREATPVLAVGPGTVAFAGNDQVYGNLVVVNHEQGLQTRYANLGTVEVEVGQSIQRGTPLGQVGPADGEESFLFFEVRLNSERGWVAQDPQDHVPSLALR